jgi:hypothetical protein
MYETVLRLGLKQNIYTPISSKHSSLVAEPPTDKYSPDNFIEVIEGHLGQQYPSSNSFAAVARYTWIQAKNLWYNAGMIYGCFSDAFFMSWQKSSGKRFGMNDKADLIVIPTAESMPAHGIHQPSSYLS